MWYGVLCKVIAWYCHRLQVSEYTFVRHPILIPEILGQQFEPWDPFSTELFLQLSQPWLWVTLLAVPSATFQQDSYLIILLLPQSTLPSQMLTKLVLLLLPGWYEVPFSSNSIINEIYVGASSGMSFHVTSVCSSSIITFKIRSHFGQMIIQPKASLTTS